MNEYEFILEDRIAKIKQIDEQYDLRSNAYIAFSGGKDSVIVHHLVDLALPDNRIPRVYLNTGIEYSNIKKYVEYLSKNDDRIILLNSNVNIKKMLKENGYPFKSKEHSERVYEFNKNSTALYIKKYITGIDSNGNKSFKKCPNILLYQFKEKGKYNYGHLCCHKLKKEPSKKWAKENNKNITITGMRKEEGGQRSNLNCIYTDAKGNLKKFHPLLIIDEKFEKEFIKRNDIKLCKLYYSPYNFKRTGCKGCPFNMDLQKDLEVMYQLLPNEYYQCINLWKPVYDEYIRIGYRLKQYPHLKPKLKKLF